MEVKQPQLPPKPTNILPEVKVPQKEYPVMPEESPMFEQPQMQPQMQMPQDYCVPITPVMPGSGFCPPPPHMVSAASLSTNVIYAISTGSRSSNATNANMMPNQPVPMPGVAGAQFMQHGLMMNLHPSCRNCR